MNCRSKPNPSNRVFAALAVELGCRDIPFERQVPLTVKYKQYCVGEGRVDLLVDGDLIVELKSVEHWLPCTSLRSSPT